MLMYNTLQFLYFQILRTFELLMRHGTQREHWARKIGAAQKPRSKKIEQSQTRKNQNHQRQTVQKQWQCCKGTPRRGGRRPGPTQATKTLQQNPRAPKHHTKPQGYPKTNPRARRQQTRCLRNTSQAELKVYKNIIVSKM